MTRTLACLLLVAAAVLPSAVDATADPANDSEASDPATAALEPTFLEPPAADASISRLVKPTPYYLSYLSSAIVCLIVLILFPPGFLELNPERQRVGVVVLVGIAVIVQVGVSSILQIHERGLRRLVESFETDLSREKNAAASARQTAEDEAAKARELERQVKELESRLGMAERSGLEAERSPAPPPAGEAGESKAGPSEQQRRNCLANCGTSAGESACAGLSRTDGAGPTKPSSYEGCLDKANQAKESCRNKCN